MLAAAFVSITVQANAIAREIAGYHADIAAAQAERAARTAHIAEQQTPDYVREKARDYGYIGPNESLIAVERSGQTSGLSAQAGNSFVIDSVFFCTVTKQLWQVFLRKPLHAD